MTDNCVYHLITYEQLECPECNVSEATNVVSNKSQY